MVLKFPMTMRFEMCNFPSMRERSCCVNFAPFDGPVGLVYLFIEIVDPLLLISYKLNCMFCLTISHCHPVVAINLFICAVFFD